MDLCKLVGDSVPYMADAQGRNPGGQRGAPRSLQSRQNTIRVFGSENPRILLRPDIKGRELMRGQREEVQWVSDKSGLDETPSNDPTYAFDVKGGA